MFYEYVGYVWGKRIRAINNPLKVLAYVASGFVRLLLIG